VIVAVLLGLAIAWESRRARLRDHWETLAFALWIPAIFWFGFSLAPADDIIRVAFNFVMASIGQFVFVTTATLTAAGALLGLIYRRTQASVSSAS